MKSNPALEKSFAFAVEIVRLARLLNEEKKEYVLSKQLLRSGTSIGANIEEGVGAESKKDFILKFSISYKEAHETHYWLRLLFETDYITRKEYEKLIALNEELLKITGSILKSARKNT